MEEDLLNLECLNLISIQIWDFLISMESIKLKNQRRWWVRPIFMKREALGDYDNLVQELRDDPELFKAYARLTVKQFDYLLSVTQAFLLKSSKRKPIPPGARLMLTLRYLASGDSMKSISFAYRVGASTVTNIVHETCDVIWNVLYPIYLKPIMKNGWMSIANEFYNKWDMPNCIGALDGKHINIKCPASSGSNFFNYKKTHSIVLLAVCDANLKFTNVDIGGYGSSSDGGILKNSMFGQYLQRNELDVPQDMPLPGDTRPMPFYIVGDEAFPLSSNIMRPFGGRGLTEDQKIFNYRLSRARRCIENAFGVLASRWRIFHTLIEAKASTMDSFVKATVVLHNYLITCDDMSDNRTYVTTQMVDHEDETGNLVLGDWREMNRQSEGLQSHTISGIRMGSRHSPRRALEIRDYLKHYLCIIDPMPRQLRHIRRGTNPDDTESETESSASC